MTDLRAVATSVLLIDYPGSEVPEAVARAGIATFAHEGPGEDEYYRYACGAGGDITREHVGKPPATVDVVYTYRPVDELAGIVEFAQTLGAKMVWFQDDSSTASASERARAIVDAAGLAYADGPIADAVR